MRTQQEMFDAIIGWEIEAGESFLDYFDGSFKEGSFMCWALGKGYVTQEQFNEWEMQSCDCHSADELLFGQEVYSVIQEPDYSFDTRDEYQEKYEQSKMILAEFMSSSVTYQRRFKEFLEEN